MTQSFYYEIVVARAINYCLSIKYHLLRYACRQNPHLRLVNSGFGDFASLATGTF
jgi:hypothetical protein